MLGYTKDDLDNASYGVRLALEALSDTPPTFPKEDLKRIHIGMGSSKLSSN